MTIPGGIRAKLALALLAIVGGALAGAYLMVVPSLERRLVDAKLDELESDALTVAAVYSRRDFGRPLAIDEFVESSSFVYGARVVVFQVLGPPPSLVVVADSAGLGATLTTDEVALETATTDRIGRGRVERGSRSFVEVAVPLLSGEILLLSSSIQDQLATVRVVERRLLYATGVAVVIALVLGSVAAAVHARRIRRLERAANRIAGRDFDEPVIDRGNDELGQLATAFEHMRVELAQLETARKEFVANASHELRTPLFSLAGFLELMADEDLDEETRAGFLATTREQIDRLTKLAADLLDLSRLDAGRLRVEREELSLNDVGRDLVEELGPVAEATGHELALLTEPDAWAIGDEERVLQIARALARNAIVHTPEGTHVVIRVARENGFARLAVEDDGPGVPVEHADRIFDRFYRVEGPQASGSGLGLAIARELAARMGGTVELDPGPGRTRFVLTLPAAPVTAEPPAAAVST